MSIRLRLTLLFSGILALTLIAFSTILYVTQAQVTMNNIKANVMHQADLVAKGPRRGPEDAGGAAGRPPGASSFVPGRWTQIRNADGTVVGQTADLNGTTLPLSDAGLNAVQKGGTWFETVQVENQPVLIYSEPVVVRGSVVQICQVAAPLAERDQSLGTLRLILTGGSGLVILAAFAMGWVLSGTALSPINRIMRTAQAIGAERNFGRRVEHVGPNDEVGQLAVTFNSMLTELESSYRQLQEALDSQRRFVADASHELRTPLTTVRGNVALLEHEPPLEAKERADVLADTKGEVERLIRLVNRLLVLARSDAGQPLRHELIHLQPLLEETCRQIGLNAPERTITCENSIDPVVRGDRDALKQVLVILLDNAVEHTSPRATIDVTESIEKDHAKIRVRDTGTGIPPHVLPHIFDRFYRGDASRTGTSTGLGLAIAKELIQAQGGTITAESQVGHGTVFTIGLPLAAD